MPCNRLSWPNISSPFFLRMALSLQIFISEFREIVCKHDSATHVILLLKAFASKSAWWQKVVFRKSPEDTCDASAQQALEELGCWSDNNFLVQWEVSGTAQYYAWMNSSFFPLSRLLPICFSAFRSSNILMPKILKNGLREKCFRTGHFTCILFLSVYTCENINAGLLCSCNYSSKPWMAI